VPNTAGVGDPLATLAVLADTAGSVQNFLDVFIVVYILLLFAYIISTWVRVPYSPWLNRIQRFLYDVCDPYLRLFRRFIPPLGPLDLSPLAGVIVLIIVMKLADTLIQSLF